MITLLRILLIHGILRPMLARDLQANGINARRVLTRSLFLILAFTACVVLPVLVTVASLP